MERLGADVKENVQAIAWAIEIATFITAAVIAWFVWKVAKRASKKREKDEADRKRN